MTTPEVFAFEVCPGTSGPRHLKKAVKRHGLSWTFAYWIGRTPVFLVMGSFQQCKSYLKAEAKQDLDNPPNFGGQMPCGMITPMPLWEALTFLRVNSKGK